MTKIEIKNIWENKTDYGMVYNCDVKLSIDDMDIYFKIQRKRSSKGTYYTQYPQDIWNLKLAQETNYNKGVNKYLFGNKAFNNEVEIALSEAFKAKGINYETGGGVFTPSEPQPVTAASTTIMNPQPEWGSVNENDDIEEIKF